MVFGTITEVTRAEVARILGGEWSGRFAEPVFLSRLWDLDAAVASWPYFDAGCAREEIQRHCVSFPGDWPDDWVFECAAFLGGCSDETFLRFVAETLHPVVRPDREKVGRLLADLNVCLAEDGWELTRVSELSGRPVFEARARQAFHSGAALEVEAYSLLPDRAALTDHLRRIHRDIEADPPGAIGSSKELVESVLKFILDESGVAHAKADNLPVLYKKVRKELSLDVSETAADKPASKATADTLRALTSAVQGLAELRNALGLGHGRTRPTSALARHARLTFNSAVAVSEFLLDTWHERRSAPVTRGVAPRELH